MMCEERAAAGKQAQSYFDKCGNYVVRAAVAAPRGTEPQETLRTFSTRKIVSHVTRKVCNVLLVILLMLQEYRTLFGVV